MRAVGGIVNTAIVMAAAGGAQDLVSLVQHCGHIELEKPWAKSLLGQMGYVKRKCSNAGRVSLPPTQIQENFLADIQAEVPMNEVPPDLIFNWDQTALHLVLTGWQTMHHTGNKIIPITNSDDKHHFLHSCAFTTHWPFLLCMSIQCICQELAHDNKPYLHYTLLQVHMLYLLAENMHTATV